MTRVLRIVPLAGLLFFFGTQAVADQVMKLSSGRDATIFMMGPLVSTHGWSALMLKYRTTVPLNDIESLRGEVDDMWARFVVDAENGNYSSAVISANEPERGFIFKTNSSYNFVFQKIEGSWRTYEAGRPPTGKLDATFVRVFLTRLDWENDHNNMNGLLLYMANDWVLSFLDPVTKNSSVQKIDRMRFAASEHALLSSASNYHHKREILNVVIDGTGTTAHVLSRETTQMTVKGRSIGDVERSTDAFVWRDGIMLWKSSEAVVQSKVNQ